MSIRVKCTICKEILNCHRDDTDTLLQHIRQKHPNLKTKNINGQVSSTFILIEKSSLYFYSSYFLHVIYHKKVYFLKVNKPLANRLSQITNSNESFRSLPYTPSPLSSTTKNAGTTIRRKSSGHKDKMTTSDTTRQQKPSSKSMLKEIDKPIESIQLPALGQPLNQSEIDKIATRQSADENKLSSADVQTIALATTMALHNGTKRKSSECDGNKLPVSRKQENILMKDCVSLQSDKKSIENTFNGHINRLENLDSKYARRKSNIDVNDIEWMREEIKKIIVRHNLACTCNVKKLQANEENKFVQFVRNRKQKLNDVKPKLPTMEWKSWKNSKNGDKKKLYKTTSNLLTLIFG